MSRRRTAFGGLPFRLPGCRIGFVGYHTLSSHDSGGQGMKYRREIDGLRAIAVLPVMLFHAEIRGFSGGFIGVDVFFVISGYLITSLLRKDLDAGRFSLSHFYERRILRIFPALLLVVLSCIPFAWAWLPAPAMRDFAESLVAVALFGSNVLFWKETGYFEAAADLKPLLHTWSLAVEEQYYVVFPLLLMLLWRFGRQYVMLALVALAVSSFGISEWGVRHHPTAAYFLLPARGWELLVGAGLAMSGWRFHEADAADKWRTTLADLGTTAGLGLIAWSVATLHRDSPFPGVAALAPTIGTALIIACAGPRTLTGRLLGSAPLVGLGLISYSAYLWHQPVLAFARHRSIAEPTVPFRLALLAASLVLAGLSWRLVEQPVRQSLRLPPVRLFFTAAASLLLLVGLGSLGMATGGASFRDIARQSVAIEERQLSNFGLDRQCDLADGLDTATSLAIPSRCRTGDAPTLVLWGDSFAMHLVQGLQASRPDLQFVQVTTSACAPILDVAMISREMSEARARGCLRRNRQVLQWLASQKTVTHVVLSSPFDIFKQTSEVVVADAAAPQPSVRVAAPAFRATLSELSRLGITPVVVSPPPRSGADLGGCLARALRFSVALTACDFPAEVASQEHAAIRSALREVAKTFRVIWLDEGMCDRSQCQVASGDSVLFYRDEGHFSREGSAFLGRTMDWVERIAAR